MAKRPRMGRNLDALLGGAARERGSKPAQTSSETAAVVLDEREPASSAQSSDVPSTVVDAGMAAPMTPASATDTTSAVTATPETRPAVAEETLEPGSVEPAASTADHPPGERLIMLGVEKIRRGTYQPRRLFDQELLQELADSIKSEGMIQPIIVRPFADGYELVAGERRWRASQLAGLGTIPAIVRDMEDRSVAAVSVIENIQRKDLNPLEEAAAFERLCDEFGMTHKAVAEAVGRSRASVTNLMRLLELHDEVKVMVDRGELEMGHARALLSAPRTRQPEIARRIVQQGMTVRSVEKYVRSLDELGNEPPPPGAGNMTDPDIDRLSKKLGDKLGARVQIAHKDNGSGKLQISYSSVSELQGILAHIK